MKVGVTHVSCSHVQVDGGGVLVVLLGVRELLP